MRDEIDSIKENKPWSLVEPMKGAKIIGLKWMFTPEGRICQT